LKKLSTILLFILLSAAIAFSAVGKLGPRLARLALSPEKASTVDGLYKNAAGAPVVDVIVTHKNGLREIRHLGAVRCSRGDIAVVTIPLSRLEALSALPSVIYVESPLPAKAQLDQSTVLIQARKAQSQRGVTGRDVVIGLIDSGIDYWHHDFRKADGSTRIKYLLDFSAPGPVYGGTVYDEDDINNALLGLSSLNETDLTGHGTHVAGIAAGDGSDGAGYGLYAGVAPEADLVIIKATRRAGGDEFLSVDQIFALTFIDSVAAVLGKPWVANLSLGGHNGAHDGTAVVERFIDELVGPEKPGKVIITVAGNDGDRDIHAAVSFSSNSASSISFNVAPYAPQAGNENDMIVLDGWYDGGSIISVTLISPSGKRLGPVLPGKILDQQTDEGAVYLWNGFYDAGSGSYQNGTNPFNGDREFYIQIYDQEATQQPAQGEWIIEFSGSGANVDVWVSSASMDVNFVQGKTDEGKLSIPGTARHAITVAAYISKKNWYDLDNNHLTFDSNGDYEKGDIAAFSSPGPVRKSAFQKPDITAPGQIIASSYSTQAPPSTHNSIFAQSDPRYPNALINEDGEHGMSSGTSMAAPHVAGAVALILELYPELTSVQVKEMLTTAAKGDQYVGAVPNNKWGWGKLDIFAALQITPGTETPAGLKLLDPWPNPFVNQTRITFELPLMENISAVKISVYNAIGQHVRTLVDGKKNVGTHTLYWDGRDRFGSPVGSGLYFIKMMFGNNKIINKVVFLGKNK